MQTLIIICSTVITLIILSGVLLYLLTKGMQKEIYRKRLNEISKLKLFILFSLLTSFLFLVLLNRNGLYYSLTLSTLISFFLLSIAILNNLYAKSPTDEEVKNLNEKSILRDDKINKTLKNKWKLKILKRR